MLGLRRKNDNEYVFIDGFNSYSKEIDIRHLIVICELGKEYKSFCNDLEELIQNSNRKNTVYDVYNVIRGKFSIHSNKYKKFIEKHKYAIDLMEKNSCTSDLTVLSYDQNGHKKTNRPEDYFYQMIEENIENIDVIKSVVNKLYSLGFKKIIFNKEWDFNDFIFDYYQAPFSYETKFCFMENMEVYPTYSTYPIKYSTTSSNYCISLRQKVFSRDISEYEKEIYMNNLIFDSNSLPDEITPETTANVIIDLANERIEEYSLIRDLVDFAIALQDLDDQYQNLYKVIERSDRSELISLMEQMRQILNKLQNNSKEYEKLTTFAFPYVTPKKLENEKKLYLHRRWESSIDYD